MKKILKKEVIIAFIVGIILASSIAVYAASYFAKDICYTKPGTETVINVEQALNELYEKNNKYTTLTLNLMTINYGDEYATSKYNFNNEITDKFIHFKIKNVVTNEYVTQCQLRGTNNNTSSNETLTENIEYNTSDYSGIWINLRGDQSVVSYDLILYN